MWGQSWREIALDILLPQTCTHCRIDLPPILTGPLCGTCLQELHPLPPEDLHSAGPVRILSAAYAYSGVVASMIRAFKYEGRRKIGEFLADWMAGLWPRKPELGSPHAFIPVPLHPRKQRFRGFNQASILARAVSRQARIPVLEALTRVFNTAAQKEQSRDRRLKQLRGAIRTEARFDIRGSRLVLIDDVATTGGTLMECARALKDAGAEDVRAFVLAKRLRG